MARGNRKAEHEITRLQAQMAERCESEIALTLTMNIVADLIQNWHQANSETRRSLNHSLFEKRLGGSEIADFAEHGLDQIGIAINRSIEVVPPPIDCDICLVHIPQFSGLPSAFSF